MVNLLIRTYVVSNLYHSLFDVPNKIPNDKVTIYVHNDNPEQKLEFIEIIQKFKQQFPNYQLVSIQEDINQHMFMSYFNSIPFIDLNNYWTMLLDDDDQLEQFDDDVWQFLSNQKSKCICIQFKEKSHWENALLGAVRPKICWCQYHRIFPTEILKQVYEYRDVLQSLLIKNNRSTKFSTFEDKLMLNIVETITKISTIKYDKILLNYFRYNHTYNSYVSVNSDYNSGTLEVSQIIDNIIQDLKNIMYEKLL